MLKTLNEFDELLLIFLFQCRINKAANVYVRNIESNVT